MLVGLMFIFAVVRFLFGGSFFSFLYSHMGEENFYTLSKGARLAFQSISILLTGGFIHELTLGSLGLFSGFHKIWNIEPTPPLAVFIILALFIFGGLAIIKSILITKENASIKRSTMNSVIFHATSISARQ